MKTGRRKVVSYTECPKPRSCATWCNSHISTIQVGIIEHFVSAKISFVLKRYDVAKAFIFPPQVCRFLFTLRRQATKGLWGKSTS